MGEATKGDRQTRFDVRVVKRNPWVLGVASLPFSLCVLAIAGALFVTPGMLILMIHGIAFGLLSLRTAWLRNPRARRIAQPLRIEDELVWIGEEAHRRSEIRAGLLVPSDGGASVRLVRPGARPDVELEVSDRAAGEALLRDLGFSAEQTVAEFRGMSLLHARVWRMVGWFFGVLAGSIALGAAFAAVLGVGGAAAGFLLFFATWIALVFAPTRVTVGVDGVLIRWLHTQRFVPHERIDAVYTSQRGLGRSQHTAVILRLTSGETLPIPVQPTTWDSGRASALMQRILEAKRVHASAGSAAGPSVLLERRGRAHGEWVRALRAVSALATHRRAPVEPEALWRVIEDPVRDPLDRAAAAVALGPALAGGGRQRLLRVAAATAAPRLRIAFDTVAQCEEEEAVAEALEALERDARRAVSPPKAR